MFVDGSKVPAWQETQLMHLVDLMLDCLGPGTDIEEFKDGVSAIDTRDFGVAPESFPIVARALLDTLERYSNLDSELKTAWTLILQYAAGAIMQHSRTQ